MSARVSNENESSRYGMKARFVLEILAVAAAVFATGTGIAQTSISYTTALQIAYSATGVPQPNTNLIVPEVLRKHEGPAENDPAGNWGFVDDGVQISLRFSKQIYFEEVIVGILMIRNVSEEQRNYFTWGAPHIQFGIVVSDDTGHEIKERGVTNDFQRRLSRIVTNPQPVHLRPHTQSVSVFRLDDVFELEQPGRYFARANVRVYHSEGTKPTEVGTGNAMFKVGTVTKQPKATDAETGSSLKVNPGGTTGQMAVPKLANGQVLAGSSPATQTGATAATGQPAPDVPGEESSRPTSASRKEATLSSTIMESESEPVGSSRPGRKGFFVTVMVGAVLIVFLGAWRLLRRNRSAV